jgi:hypothetical protein
MSTGKFIEAYLGRKPKHQPKLVVGSGALPEYLRRLSIFAGGVKGPYNTSERSEDDESESEGDGHESGDERESNGEHESGDERESNGEHESGDEHESEDEPMNVEAHSSTHTDQPLGIDEFLEKGLDDYLAKSDETNEEGNEYDERSGSGVVVIGGVYQRLKSASTVEKDLLSLFHVKPERAHVVRHSTRAAHSHKKTKANRVSRASRVSPTGLKPAARSYKGMGGDKDHTDINEYLVEL